MVLHLALLGTFAAVGGFDSAPISEPPIEAVWQAPDEEFLPVNLVMQPVAAHGPSTPGNLDDPLAPQFDVDVSAASLTAGGGQGQGLPGRSVSASDLRRSLGRGLAGMGGGSGEGKGAGGGRGFFGRGVAGQRVVYVVDSSRSMNHPHPGEGKTRLGRVKLELINAIKALQPDQKFFIVFFNDAPIPMPSDRLVEANDATKLQFLRWMVDVPASGQTDPAMALLLALKLNPDTIYFLTDGDFRPTIVRELAVSNRRGVTIHTIGFTQDRGESLLRTIAKQNQGTYTYVPPDEAAPEPEVEASAPAASVATP